MKTLNIIGCGNVGKTLGYLWAKSRVFQLQDLLNTSKPSANRAVEFIGAGRAIESISEMRPADIILISTVDSQIKHVSEQLAETSLVSENTIVFHCSGSLSSEELSSLRGKTKLLASIHPVKSFAEPSSSITNFLGTYCAFEGATEAYSVLSDAFQMIGANIFLIKTEGKTLYHAATVMACNYLVALLEVSLKLYEQSGVPREQAQKIIQPIIDGTLENIYALGTSGALTGPIARGEVQTIKAHLESLTRWNPDYAELYSQLGAITLEISRGKGAADSEALMKIEKLF